MPQRRPLFALIAALPMADFMQIGLVAFGAAPIMGSIHAGPEEYSLVATAYAVVAIGVIALHRWLVERLGWRTLMMLSAAALAAGALICGFSDSLPAFGLGRVTMALGCASFVTAGRVLVNHIPPSPRRFTGIRFFAAGVAWGLVLGPLLAAQALSSYGWRASFFALLLPAALIASLSFCVLDDAPSSAHVERSQSNLTGMLALMGGSFALLHALQRSAFDYLDRPSTLWAAAAIGLAALLAFGHAQGSVKRQPLIRLGAMRQSSYLLGLVMFGVAFVVLGANSYMLPLLLRQAFGLPLETVGRFLSLGALGSVFTWIVVSRLLRRNQGPTRYYVAGFCALMFCGVRLASLSESANSWISVMPALLCNGAFIILVLSSTALQTFKSVQHDEAILSHANQVKNMLGQFGVAAGMALATLCMQWRSTVRSTRLGESMMSSNFAVQQTLDQMTRYFESHGDPAAAPRLALAQLAQSVAQEVAFTAAVDYFVILAAFAGVCLVAVLLQAAWKPLAASVR